MKKQIATVAVLSVLSMNAHAEGIEFINNIVEKANALLGQGKDPYFPQYGKNEPWDGKDQAGYISRLISNAKDKLEGRDWSKQPNTKEEARSFWQGRIQAESQAGMHSGDGHNQYWWGQISTRTKALVHNEGWQYRGIQPSGNGKRICRFSDGDVEWPTHLPCVLNLPDSRKK